MLSSSTSTLSRLNKLQEKTASLKAMRINEERFVRSPLKNQEIPQKNIYGYKKLSSKNVDPKVQKRNILFQKNKIKQ